jgi:hypothetical protein
MSPRIRNLNKFSLAFETFSKIQIELPQPFSLDWTDAFGEIVSKASYEAIVDQNNG